MSEEIHEECGRQALDDQHFEPPFDEGDEWEDDEGEENPAEGACILPEGANADDCTTHEHEHNPVDTGKWVCIVFMQGDDANAVLDKLCRFDGVVTYRGATEESVRETLEELKQWDYGDESEHNITDKPEWGESDRTIEEGEYVIAYNLNWGYISLNRKIGGAE